MKNTIYIIAFSIVLLQNISVYGQTKYQAETGKSELIWVGQKVAGNHSGTIQLSSGEFLFEGEKLISAKFEIDMTSIKNTDLTDETYRSKLEGHLKSDDFFGVQTYPKATFVLDKPVKIEKGSTLVKGNLTIKGITNPIEFKATFVKTTEGYKILAIVIVDRTKYNVRYGSSSFFDNLGDKIIYDEFGLKVSIVAKKI